MLDREADYAALSERIRVVRTDLFGAREDRFWPGACVFPSARWLAWKRAGRFPVFSS